MKEKLELYARALEDSGQYKVLRRFDWPQQYAGDYTPDRQVRKGVFLDVETTGIDWNREELIELAMVPFEYTDDGRVYRVGEAFEGLRDPGRKLSRFVKTLTGLTDEQLAGQTIDPDEVAAFLEGTSLLVAHNAAFDRPFFEKTFPGLPALPWACSIRDVPWRELGVESSKLEYLAFKNGIFFDGHRAQIDCRVGIHLLATDWVGAGSTPLAILLQECARTEARLWATGSPFKAKDRLKERGYRFDGRGKVWYRDLNSAELENEKVFLAREVYGEMLQRSPRIAVEVAYITARERYGSNAQGQRSKVWIERETVNS